MSRRPRWSVVSSTHAAATCTCSRASPRTSIPAPALLPAPGTGTCWSRIKGRRKPFYSRNSSTRMTRASCSPTYPCCILRRRAALVRCPARLATPTSTAMASHERVMLYFHKRKSQMVSCTNVEVIEFNTISNRRSKSPELRIVFDSWNAVFRQNTV